MRSYVSAVGATLYRQQTIIITRKSWIIGHVDHGQVTDGSDKTWVTKCQLQPPLNVEFKNMVKFGASCAGLIMTTVCNRAGHYIFVLWFLLLLLLSFFFFSSPILSRRRLDVYHTSTRE